MTLLWLPLQAVCGGAGGGEHPVGTYHPGIPGQSAVHLHSAGVLLPSAAHLCCLLSLHLLEQSQRTGPYCGMCSNRSSWNPTVVIHCPPIEWSHPTCTIVFCITVGGNLCQCQYKAPDNTWKISCDPWTNFYGRSSLLSCPSQPSFVGVLISPTTPKAVWRTCAGHYFRCEPSYLANYHLKPQSHIACNRSATSLRPKFRVVAGSYLSAIKSIIVSQDAGALTTIRWRTCCHLVQRQSTHNRRCLPWHKCRLQ